LHEEQTQFQKIEIFRTTGWGNLMVIDGCTMLSTRDNFIYHEMMAHPVLYSHPDPEHVVIIGGGDCGTLQEVLKHPEVKTVRQIDIDERVTRLSEEYFPELCTANNDPRAELMFIDGIDWMKHVQAGSVDVIIVDSTDPIGPGEVLFSQEFYRACHVALREDGMLIQQSESPLVHEEIVQRMYRDMRRADFNHIDTLFFPLPIYPSGWWSATISSKKQITPLNELLTGNIIELNTRYYSPEIHVSAFAKPRFFSDFAKK
jgi:spermidine synthase